MRARAWRPWVLVAWMTASAGVVVAQSPADAVVQQLREQGYVEFEVSRTLLGRIRVLAIAPDGGQREIVFNPATGEILRDYSEAGTGGAVPRILDRSEDDAGSRVAGNDDASRPDDGKAGPQAASSPSADSGGEDAPRPDQDTDGDHGHGNDDGFDDDNPGRGHGNDGSPGGGRGGGNNGNGNGHGSGGGGGNGNGTKPKD